MSKKNNEIYGLFQYVTDYDTCENLMMLSFNKNKLEKIRKKRNAEIKKEIQKKCKVGQKIGISFCNNYEKLVQNRFNKEKYFIRKLVIERLEKSNC